MYDIDKDLKSILSDFDNNFAVYTDRELFYMNFLNDQLIRSDIEKLKNIVLLSSFVILVILCWILLVCF